MGLLYLKASSVVVARKRVEIVIVADGDDVGVDSMLF